MRPIFFFGTGREHRPKPFSAGSARSKNGFAIDAITGDVRDTIIVADVRNLRRRALTTQKAPDRRCSRFVAQLFLQVHRRLSDAARRSTAVRTHRSLEPTEMTECRSYPADADRVD